MIGTSICVLFVVFVVWLFLHLMFSEGDTYTFGGANVNGVLINEYTDTTGYDSANGCYIVVDGAYSKTVKESPALPRIKANDYGGYEEI